MEAMGGLEWKETGGGEVVPAEDFSGVPREYVDDFGETKKVWSPLKTLAWGSCSRHDPSGRVTSIMVAKQEAKPQLQLSMFGGDD